MRSRDPEVSFGSGQCIFSGKGKDDGDSSLAEARQASLAMILDPPWLVVGVLYARSNWKLLSSFMSDLKKCPKLTSQFTMHSQCTVSKVTREGANNSHKSLLLLNKMILRIKL